MPPVRGIRRGVTTGDKPSAVELHVKVTFRPQSEVVRPGQPITGSSGRALSGGAASAARDAAARGREDAKARLREVAQAAASAAQTHYAALGFTLPVVARAVGSGWRVEVQGNAKDQMMARVLEGGASGVMMHDFILKARRRRTVKVTRRNSKGEEIPRGKITEREGGSYLIIPKVHARVTRTPGGKITVEPLREGLSEELMSQEKRDARAAIEGYQKWNAAAQFVAKPEGAEVKFNEGQMRAAEHGLDARRGFNPETGRVGTIMLGANPTGFRGQPSAREMAEYVGNRPVQQDSEAWEVIRYGKQKVRKAGVTMEATIGRRKAGDYVRDSRQDPAESRASQDRATQKGAKLMAALGVSNLRINDPSVTELRGSAAAETNQQVRKQSGEVVSFRTISTRQEDRVLFKGRAAQNVLGKVMDQMRAQLQEDARTMRSARNAEGFYGRAFLEVLDQALR